MGDHDGALSCQVDGNTLTGTMTGPAGAMEIQSGTVDGDSATFTGEITSPFGDVLAQAGETRDGGSFYDRMGSVACWNAVMDENQYMVRKWNEFISS